MKPYAQFLKDLGVQRAEQALGVHKLALAAAEAVFAADPTEEKAVACIDASVALTKAEEDASRAKYLCTGSIVDIYRTDKPTKRSKK